MITKKSIPTPLRVWIRDAAEQLAATGITTAKLDAEIILAHTLRKSRTWIHAHDDEALSATQLQILDARLALRLDRTPIAYIIGHKEFYSRMFHVTPSVLIPRPESEAIIELLKTHLPHNAARLIDIGTGSGCLGITAKLELPKLDVTLSDISRHALTLAERNAAYLNAEITTVKADLLAGINGRYDVVIANLPYVDTTWERSPETNHEPALALFAERHGLALIERLIEQLPAACAPSALVLLEADPEQHPAMITLLTKKGYTHTATDGYILAFTYTN